MNTLIFAGVVVLLIIILISLSVVIVQQQEIRIIERFGKFHKILLSGLHFKMPFMDHVVGRFLNFRIQQINVEVETKTKDNVFVKLQVSIQYQVLANEVFNAYYKLYNVESQMESYVFDVVRSHVPSMLLDEVFEKKDSIAKALKKDLGETMAAFGYDIIQSLVTDIEPDAKVKTAMNEINEQLRLKLAAKEQAEGLKIRRVTAAEADAEAMRLTGIGIAQQRKAIVGGLRSSIENFSESVKGVTAKDVMNLVLRVQYYDTLKDVTQNSASNTILLPTTEGNTPEQKNLETALRNAIISGELAVKKNSTPSLKPKKSV